MRLASTLLVLALANACGELSAVDNPVAPRCGDWRIDPGEECDEGEYNGSSTDCTTSCRYPVCGDGLVSLDESCDDANADPDDGCDECRTPGDAVWSLSLSGSPTSLRASPDEWVYVAGRGPVGVLGDEPASAVLIIDGPAGVAMGGAPYSVPPSPSEPMDTFLAPHPQGGVASATSIRLGSLPAAEFVSWFDSSGSQRWRYQSGTSDGGHILETVATSPSGLVAVGGSIDGLGLSGVIDEGARRWTYKYQITVSYGHSVRAVDIDDSGRVLVGGALGEQAWVALNGNDATLRWLDRGTTLGERILAVRLAGSSCFVVRAEADGGVYVDERSTNSGTVQATTALAIDPYDRVIGAQLMSDGRVLSFGQGGWLALHWLDGTVVWSATDALDAFIDAYTATGAWVYALHGHRVEGYHARQ